MRGVGLFVLAVVLLVATPGQGLAKRVEAVRLQGLALLREPGDSKTLIKALAVGEVVTVLGRQGDYVSVATKDGKQGFVQGGFLTGFADITPIKAYAGRIDASVTRPGQDKDAQTAEATAPVPAAKPEAAAAPSAKAPAATALQAKPEAAPARGAPASQSALQTAAPGSKTGYKPVADGGGLDLYIANLNRSLAADKAGQANLTADFNDRKNKYAIEVHLSERKLYLYEQLANGTKFLLHTYVVAVPGREMEAPQGWGVVTGISFDPWWRPTPAMKQRALAKGKSLPESVRPGVRENPMGTFKIILSHGYGFRIHGNNNPGSIGRPVTSGCIRMRNDEGRDMARMIDVGTEVVFLE